MSRTGEYKRNVATIAEEYGVSLRTARRHVQRGTLPSSNRVTGMDGKSYPGGLYHHREGTLSPAGTSLSMARSNVRAAARATGFNDKDLQHLASLLDEATELWRRWSESKEYHSHE